MAFKRKIAIDKVRNLQNTFADHVLKLFLFPDSVDYNHWCREIDGYLREINSIKIKPHGDKLFHSQLFEMLFDEPLGTRADLEDRIHILQSEYPNNSDIHLNFDVLTATLMSVVNNICRDLSLGQVKSIKSYL